MEIVLYCLLLFYADVTEFVFGPVGRGMTERKPVVVTHGIICSNLGILYNPLTGVKTHP